MPWSHRLCFYLAQFTGMPESLILVFSFFSGRVSPRPRPASINYGGIGQLRPQAKNPHGLCDICHINASLFLFWLFRISSRQKTLFIVRLAQRRRTPPAKKPENRLASSNESGADRSEAAGHSLSPGMTLRPYRGKQV